MASRDTGGGPPAMMSALVGVGDGPGTSPWCPVGNPLRQQPCAPPARRGRAGSSGPVGSTVIATVRRFVWRVSRLLWILAVVALGTGVIVGAALAVAPHGDTVFTAVDLSRIETDFDLTPGAQRSEIYDRYGNQIGELNTAVIREIVPYDRIPIEVINTVLAVEDEKFFRHNGFDLKGTMRALLSNVSTGGIRQGGSTITQQIIKLRVVGNEQTFNRKLREAILASRLEEELTKEELLEFYLNEIYFGNGAYGIQAAAETYFGKDVGELDYGDASLLAGMIRAPSIFDGFEDFDVAQTRRTVALGRLVDLEYITEDDKERFLRRPLPTRNLSPTIHRYQPATRLFRG